MKQNDEATETVRKAVLGVANETVKGMKVLSAAATALNEKVGEALRQNRELAKLQERAALLHGTPGVPGDVAALDRTLKEHIETNKTLLNGMRQDAQEIQQETRRFRHG